MVANSPRRRRFRRWPRISGVVLALVFISALQRALQFAEAFHQPVLTPPATVTVVDVFAGPTLLAVDPGQPAASFQLRLLGLSIRDEAAARNWLENECRNRQVKLVFDRRRQDRDGTWLVYAWQDHTFLNADLISKGWAGPLRYPGDALQYERMFVAAAQASQR